MAKAPKQTDEDSATRYALCDIVHQGTRAEAEKAIEHLKKNGATVEITGSDVVVRWEGVERQLSMRPAPKEDVK